LKPNLSQLYNQTNNIDADAISKSVTASLKASGIVLPEPESFWDQVAGKGKIGLTAIGDVLSIPQRAIAGSIDDASSGDIGGLLNLYDNATNKENDPSQVLNIDSPGWALAADLLLDPVNLLAGVGVATKTGKLGKIGDSVNQINKVRNEYALSNLAARGVRAGTIARANKNWDTAVRAGGQDPWLPIDDPRLRSTVKGPDGKKYKALDYSKRYKHKKPSTPLRSASKPDIDGPIQAMKDLDIGGRLTDGVKGVNVKSIPKVADKPSAPAAVRADQAAEPALDVKKQADNLQLARRSANNEAFPERSPAVSQPLGARSDTQTVADSTKAAANATEKALRDSTGIETKLIGDAFEGQAPRRSVADVINENGRIPNAEAEVNVIDSAAEMVQDAARRQLDGGYATPNFEEIKVDTIGALIKAGDEEGAYQLGDAAQEEIVRTVDSIESSYSAIGKKHLAKLEEEGVTGWEQGRAKVDGNARDYVKEGTAIDGRKLEQDPEIERIISGEATAAERTELASRERSKAEARASISEAEASKLEDEATAIRAEKVQEDMLKSKGYRREKAEKISKSAAQAKDAQIKADDFARERMLGDRHKGAREEQRRKLGQKTEQINQLELTAAKMTNEINRASGKALRNKVVQSGADALRSLIKSSALKREFGSPQRINNLFEVFMKVADSALSKQIDQIIKGQPVTASKFFNSLDDSGYVNDLAEALLAKNLNEATKILDDFGFTRESVKVLRRWARSNKVDADSLPEFIRSLKGTTGADKSMQGLLASVKLAGSFDSVAAKMNDESLYHALGGDLKDSFLELRKVDRQIASRKSQRKIISDKLRWSNDGKARRDAEAAHAQMEESAATLKASNQALLQNVPDQRSVNQAASLKGLLEDADIRAGSARNQSNMFRRMADSLYGDGSEDEIIKQLIDNQLFEGAVEFAGKSSAKTFDDALEASADMRRAWIAFGLPIFGPRYVFYSKAFESLRLSFLVKMIDKAPQGSAALKSLEYLADKERGRLSGDGSKAVNAMKAMFLPGFDIDGYVYAGYRHASGIASRQAGETTQLHGAIADAINPTQRRALDKFVEEVEGGSLNFEEDALDILQKTTPETYKLWEEMGEQGQEWFKYALNSYKLLGHQLEMSGHLQRGVIKGLYFPKWRVPEAESMAGQTFVSSSPNAALHREEAFQKVRTLIGGTEETLVDPVKALDHYIHKSYSVLEAGRLGEVIRKKFAVTMPRTATMADEAASSGLVRPTNKIVSKTFSDTQFIPKEIDDSIQRLNGIVAKEENLVLLGRAMQSFTGMVRTLSYMVAPGRLTIDTVGDVWNSSLNGINLLNPSRNKRMISLAHQIDQYSKGLALGTDEFRNAESGWQKYLRSQDAKFLEGGDEIGKMVTIGGEEVPLIKVIYALSGSNLLTMGRSEASMGKMGTVIAPGAGIVRRAGQTASRGMEKTGRFRDNHIRVAIALAAIEQNIKNGVPVQEALYRGALQTKQATFDYSELTGFEQRWMRNIAPFYTWSRKNIPYQLRKLADAPWGFNLATESQEASFEAADLPAGALPEYVRDMGFGIPGLMLGGDHLAINPMLPSLDLGLAQNYRTGAETGTIARAGFDFNDLMSMANPIIRAPIEINQGKTLYTEQEINNLSSYMLLTFGGQLGGLTTKAATKDLSATEKTVPLVGFLTGARVRAVDMEKELVNQQYTIRAINDNNRKAEERDTENDDKNLFQRLFGR